MLGEPVIVKLSDINYSSTKPYTRNHRGEWLQNPYIEIKTPNDGAFALRGKLMMWNYLDALFADDTLPRDIINEDIFAPTVKSPSLYSLLIDFTDEVVSNGVEYIVVYHIDGDIRYVEPFNQALLSDIDVMAEGLGKLSGKKVLKKPFVYRGTKVTIRPALQIGMNGNCLLEIVDIGVRWYYRLTAHDTNMYLVGLIEPHTTMKNDSEHTLETIRKLINIGTTTKIGDGTSTQYPISNDMRTAEQDRILKMRWSI